MGHRSLKTQWSILNNMVLTYKQSGVDIKAADRFVDGIKNFVSKDPLSKVAAFGSLFALGPYLKNCKDPILVSSTDGVGTKLKIAQKLNIHNTVGIDLVGMNVNDVLCMGAKPLFFLDYVGCGKVDVSVLHDVVAGIHRGLNDSDCKLLGGETAEMPGMYDDDEYDLAGFCVGIVDKKKMIDTSRIKPGDAVIGLESNGLHSNGFSLVRKALGESGVRKYGNELLKPTRIYVKPVLKVLERVRVKGLAHITGGAFYSKATKILGEGLGMKIYKRSWEVPEIFKIIQREGNIPEKEMFTVLNMGIGMMMVVDKKDIVSAMGILADHGVKNYLIGAVVESNKKMLIK